MLETPLPGKEEAFLSEQNKQHLYSQNFSLLSFSRFQLKPLPIHRGIKHRLTHGGKQEPRGLEYSLPVAGETGPLSSLGAVES